MSVYFGVEGGSITKTMWEGNKSKKQASDGGSKQVTHSFKVKF